MARLLATFFFVGRLRPAPGTWGSLAAVLLALPMAAIGGVLLVLVGAALAFGLGLWATAAVTAPGDHDPSFVVIDEVAGQWITLLPLVWAYEGFVGEKPTTYYACTAAAFVLFRLFDIWKPWPVSWADNRSDALGVMLDDVIAGVMAAAVLACLLFLLTPNALTGALQ